MGYHSPRIARCIPENGKLFRKGNTQIRDPEATLSRGMDVSDAEGIL